MYDMNYTSMELDRSLLDVLNYLIKYWYNKNTGIVACAIKDNDKIAYATSQKVEGMWLHAEYNAFNQFKNLYGVPSKNAIFITTLSPCIKKLENSKEAACIELIKSLGIKRIHFGSIDYPYVESVSIYADMGLLPSISQDVNLIKVCDSLRELFNRYSQKIDSELPKIKLGLGNSLFKPIM